MRRAYLLIVLPALIVGIFYLVVFRSMGWQLQPAPFLGAIAAFLAGLLIVRRSRRRKGRRRGG